MKVFTFLLCLFLTFDLSGQACGNTFWSQADIDNFPSDHPGCTEIPGLQLQSDVTNLDSFYNVTKISGTVYLSSNNIIDVSGIQNVDSIIGYVNLDNITVNGDFGGVEYIGGNLEISNSDNQGEQIDFVNLQYINGNLRISNSFSSTVDSLNCFNELDSLNGYISISLNNSNIEGFNQVQKVDLIQFSISNNSNNFDKGVQNAFNSLISTDRVQYYGGSGALIFNSFSSLTTIDDYILLDFVSAPVFPFSALTSTDRLTMRSVRELNSLSGLHPNLDITDELYISRCNSITDLDGLMPLHLTNLNSIQIRDNSSLSLCDYDHICGLLNGSISFTLSGNANGCKDIEQLTNRCTETGTPPVNDQCANAVEIFYSDPIDCAGATVYTTNSARMHQETFCVTDFGEEVFFTFTPSESKAFSIMLAEYDKAMGMELYQESCDDKVLLQCGYSELSRYLEADSTYLISVFCDIPTEFTDFKICVGETTLEGDVDGFGVNVASPLQDLHIDGAILIGNTELDYAGSIRFNGTHFQGFNGFDWVNLDGVGTIGFQMPGYSSDTANAKASADAKEEEEKFQEEKEELKLRLKILEEKYEALLKKMEGN